MDVNNNAWYFTGEIDYKKIPLIQKCKNIIVKCSVTTNFEVDNIISYLHNICSSGEMKTLDLREFYLVLIYISTLENHRKGWSREIPEPVFSIYLTILFPLLSKQKPKTYLYRLLLLPCC